jgi:hypothetical protein
MTTDVLAPTTRPAVHRLEQVRDRLLSRIADRKAAREPYEPLAAELLRVEKALAQPCVQSAPREVPSGFPSLAEFRHNLIRLDRQREAPRCQRCGDGWGHREMPARVVNAEGQSLMVHECCIANSDSIE